MPWAARDKDGKLGIHSFEPTRSEENWETVTTKGGLWEADMYWYPEDHGPDPLPELKWEDDPVKIELKVVRKVA